MSKKRYTYLNTFIYAWFDKNLYRDVAKHWNGVATGYLLTILTLSWLPVLLGLLIFSAYFKHSENYPKLVAQVPHVVIKDGQMRFNKASPHFIQDDKNNKFVVFDTNASPNDILTYRSVVLFTKQELAIILPMGLRVIPLKHVGSWDFDSNSFDRWVTKSLYWLVTMGFPMIVLVSLCFRLFEAFCLGIITWIVNLIFRTRLGFITSVRLSTIALTPAIAISMLEYINYQMVYRLGWFTLLITLGYAVFAVLSNREQGN